MMTLDLDLPEQAVFDIAQGGDNEEAVSYWCDTLELYSKISRLDAYDAIRELGSHSERELEEMSTKTMIQFAVWDLAWYLSETNQNEGEI